MDGYALDFEHVTRKIQTPSSTYKDTFSNFHVSCLFLFVIFIFVFRGQVVSLEGQPEQPESLRADHVSPPENQTFSDFTGK